MPLPLSLTGLQRLFQNSGLPPAVDERDRPGQFVLTGSHNFLLLQGISQSLAGRCAVLHLLPFSLSELSARPALSIEKLGRPLPGRVQHGCCRIRARGPRLDLPEVHFRRVRGKTRCSDRPEI